MDPDEIKHELDALKAEKFQLLKLINHDIRSPFNRIFALMQLLELDTPELTPAQQDYFNAIYLTALSGLEMVQNLKDMRDIDAGLVKIEMSEVTMDELIRKSLRSYSRQLELKNITVNPAIETTDVKLQTDGYYLQRCIENVLSNAIKFTPLKKTLQISSRVEGTKFMLEIQDNGPGIRMEEEQYLYEKFRKLSSLATGGEGSLGLGMYNTYHFIKMIGGSIQLQRNGKLGSCFVLEIPAL